MTVIRKKDSHSINEDTLQPVEAFLDAALRQTTE